MHFTPSIAEARGVRFPRNLLHFHLLRRDLHYYYTDLVTFVEYYQDLTARCPASVSPVRYPFPKAKYVLILWHSLYLSLPPPQSLSLLSQRIPL